MQVSSLCTEYTMFHWHLETLGGYLGRRRIFLDPDIFGARRSLANLMAVLATADTDEDTVSVSEFRFNDAGRWIVNFQQL
jgi:hypothetical protein